MPVSPEFESWNRREVARLLRLVETERHYYQEIVLSLPVPLAVLNSAHALVWANRTFRHVFQVSAEDLRCKRRLEDIIAVKELTASLTSAFEAGFTAHPLLINHGGRQLRVRIQPVRDWTEECDQLAILAVEDLTVTEGDAPAVESMPTPAAGKQPVEPSPAAPPVRAVPYVAWTAESASDGFVFKEVSQSLELVAGIKAAAWVNAPAAFAERIAVADRARVLHSYAEWSQARGTYSIEFALEGQPGRWYRETILVEPEQPLSGVLLDVTSRREMEEQLIQSQRVDALKGLSRKIAHETNNQLMIIGGYAEELTGAFPPTDPRQGDVKEILEATQRVAGLTSAMQKWARPEVVPTSPVNVGAQMAKAAERMRSTIGEYLQVDFLPPASLVSALADEEQLEIAILKLAASLVEGSGDKAQIAMATSVVQVREWIHDEQPLAPGTYVEILIANRNGGYQHATPRLFETPIPAKEPGLDTPYELTKTYKLVQQWGGTIQRAGKAGEIRIYLKPVPGAPATEDAAAAAVEPTTTPTAALRKPRYLILVVEDDTGIRALMRRILAREGYEVAEAADGIEALEWLEKNGAAHLLITDVNMPKLDGRELSNRVAGAYPQTAIIYMSGNPGLEATQFPPRAHYLPKPFTVGSLLRKVNEALNSRSRGEGA